MVETIDHDTLIAVLDRMKLIAIGDQIDSLLNEVARSDTASREALRICAGDVEPSGR